MLNNKLPYHTSIKTLPIYNFYEVLKTGKHDLLWKDEVGEEDLTEVWKEIYNEYCEEAKIDNRHLVQIAKVHELILKHNVIAQTLQMLPQMNKENAERAAQWLKTKGYILDTEKPLEPQYKALKSKLSSLDTKINIEKNKLPKEDKQEAVSLMKQVVSLENMKPGINIDIYTETVEKWLARLEAASEEIKIRKAQSEKRKK